MAALIRSSLPASGSRYSGRSRGPTRSRIAITGSAGRNTEPHQKRSKSSPPISGPIAAPAEKLVIHTPMANVRCRGSSNMLRIRDRVEGARVAPATPSSARAPMSISALVEKAATTEARPEAGGPDRSRGRGPDGAADVPNVERNPAAKKPLNVNNPRRLGARGLGASATGGKAKVRNGKSNG